MAPLDELDTKLIELLQRDGRASNIELARKTGVSEGTIRRRFRNLVQEEVIRVVAIPDTSKLGRRMSALVGLKVDPAHVQSAAEALAKMEEVHYAAVTTGAFDDQHCVDVGTTTQRAIRVLLERDQLAPPRSLIGRDHAS